MSLVGAIKRVFEPGCKFDTALVLCGGQGLGKTEIVSRLGGDWFSNSLATFKGKDAFEQLQGSWIIEIGELEALRTNELETVKHFMTKTSDKFRGAYQRRTETVKRQCIFVGTSNNHDFLKDPTGDRRWYPIDVGETSITKNLFKELTKEVVGQIWAEAYELYKKGETHYLRDEKLIEISKEVQLAHREESPYQGIVDNYLSTLVPSNWSKMDVFERKNYLRGSDCDDFTLEEGTERIDKVCILQIWTEALEGQKKDLTRAVSNEIKKCILRSGEWEQSSNAIRLGKVFGTQKGFILKNVN